MAAVLNNLAALLPSSALRAVPVDEIWTTDRGLTDGARDGERKDAHVVRGEVARRLAQRAVRRAIAVSPDLGLGARVEEPKLQRGQSIYRACVAASSAPVTSATSTHTWRPLERRRCTAPGAVRHSRRARRVVEVAVRLDAALSAARERGCGACPRACTAEGVGVAGAARWLAAAAVRDEPGRTSASANVRGPSDVFFGV